jgi:hypothetical protein
MAFQTINHSGSNKPPKALRRRNIPTYNQQVRSIQTIDVNDSGPGRTLDLSTISTTKIVKPQKRIQL